MHNLEVAMRHMQESKTTKIVTDVARAVPPLSPAVGWTFIALPVKGGDSTKYVERAQRLSALFNDDHPAHIDSAWVACSVVAYAAHLQPYVVPHPLELVQMGWDRELEERFTLKYK